MENVRLFDVIHLVGVADETARREAAVGEVIEEGFVGDKAGHADDAPAGEGFQLVGEAFEIGDAALGQLQGLGGGHKLAAGAARQQFHHALGQRVPAGVFFRRIGVPALVDRVVGGDGADFAAGAGRGGHWNLLEKVSSLSRHGQGIGFQILWILREIWVFCSP